MAYKCRIFSSSQPGEMEEFENLMTKASESDTISIVQKETKLTESGAYLIALHWIEEPQDASVDKNTLSAVIEDGF